MNTNHDKTIITKSIYDDNIVSNNEDTKLSIIGKKRQRSSSLNKIRNNHHNSTTSSNDISTHRRSKRRNDVEIKEQMEIDTKEMTIESKALSIKRKHLELLDYNHEDNDIQHSIKYTKVIDDERNYQKDITSSIDSVNSMSIQSSSLSSPLTSSKSSLFDYSKNYSTNYNKVATNRDGNKSETTPRLYHVDQQNKQTLEEMKSTFTTSVTQTATNDTFTSSNQSSITLKPSSNTNIITILVVMFICNIFTTFQFLLVVLPKIISIPSSSMLNSHHNYNLQIIMTLLVCFNIVMIYVLSIINDTASSSSSSSSSFTSFTTVYKKSQYRYHPHIIPPKHVYNKETHDQYISNMTLRQFLSNKEGFHLGLGPAYFGFYVYFGTLTAFQESIVIVNNDKNMKKEDDIIMLLPQMSDEGPFNDRSSYLLKSVAGASAGSYLFFLSYILKYLV